MSDPIFIGLDGEMTGTLTNVHQLIQLGLAIPGDMKRGQPQMSKSWDIGWDHPLLDPQAMAVNGFTIDRIEAAPRAEAVDAQILQWLDDRGVTERTSCIPVGWNVASFDMPFVRKTLPLTAELFSRRAVDLNALCFSLHRWPDGQTWKAWKRWSKQHAEERLKEQGIAPQWHDAGYDALASLYEWEFLKRREPRLV